MAMTLPPALSEGLVAIAVLIVIFLCAQLNCYIERVRERRWEEDVFGKNSAKLDL